MSSSSNNIKTAVLLAALTGIMLLIGAYWGRLGLTIAIIIAILFNFGAFFFAHKIVLKMYKAKEATENDYPKLHSMVRELSRRAGLPKPKIYIVNSHNPNAFATGPTYKKGVVAFTTGILDLLDEDELKGVAAHELSHIKNRDTLISTIAATIAGVISYVAAVARWGAIFGGVNDREGGVELLVLAILTPIMALFIQLAISRSREFVADATGAKLCHSGQGLANALLKLENGSRHNPMKMGNQSTHNLFIVNPLSGKRIFSLLSTHPATEERVKKLRSMRF